VTDNLVVLYNKHADAESCLEHNVANVVFLEDQVKSLEVKLLSKSTELKCLEVEITSLERTIEFNSNAKLGVSIRYPIAHWRFCSFNMFFIAGV
jgi:hypothetical protein